MSGKQTSSKAFATKESEIVKAEVNISTAKKRKLTSDVWDHFTKKEDGDGKKIPVIGRDDTKNKSVSEGNVLFDQQRSSMDVARLIIKHHHLLNIVEDEFFSIFIKNLQPMFRLQSKEAMFSDILHVYNEERHKLLKCFDNLSCRFSLTISLWTHDDLEKTTYCCYTVQFIDDNWELKKKILGLRRFGNPFDKSFFYESLKKLLVEWKLDKKVCSLIIHNSSSRSEIADQEIIKSWNCFENSHPLSLFYISCSDECIDDTVRTNACLRDICRMYKGRMRKRPGRGYPLMDMKSENKWSKCSLVLAIAAILDPRFKLEYVKLCYILIYGSDGAKFHLRKIRDALTDIFDDINSSMKLNDEENTMDSFDWWCSSRRNANSEASWKSELVKYVEEPIVCSCSSEFDIIGWWGEQASKFPILGKMVPDILAIPMSNIISGSTFSTEKEMVNNLITSGLDPQLMEAMICGRDWLESPKECKFSCFFFLLLAGKFLLLSYVTKISITAILFVLLNLQPF